MPFDNNKHGQCIISPYDNYNYVNDFITVYYSDNHPVPDNPAELSADMANLLGNHQKPLNDKKLSVYIEIHADSSDIDTPARADEYQALSQ